MPKYIFELKGKISVQADSEADAMVAVKEEASIDDIRFVLVATEWE